MPAAPSPDNAPPLADARGSVTAGSQALQQAILAGFQDRLEPRPVPLHYRLGLFAAAIMMVLLPVVYVGLIVLVCCGVYWHATHGLVLFEGHGSGKAALLMYVGPLVAGGILVLFMIKPLFARAAKRQKARTVSPSSEPLLYQFIARLCRTVGAPMPREIQVDCQVNASAGFRRGLLSMLGSDLALTIGLPLAAGLSLREFAGVLAHEFGHFAQGAGMRMTYVVRSINLWFARVVYDRDEWDEALTQWSHELDIRIGVIFYVARLFVWLTRRILWVLMLIGHGVSCFLLRQMEYDADRMETALAGSKSFEATVHKLGELSVATQATFGILRESWAEGRLADDLTAMILARRRDMPREVGAEIEKMIAASQTGLFDTHPADADRIAAARRASAPGSYALPEGAGTAADAVPATVLFSHFEELSKAATADFYRENIGNQVKPGNLVPTAALLQQQSKEEEAGKLLERYFQAQLSRLRPVPLPAIFLKAPDDNAAAVGVLQAARERMLQSLAACRPALKEYDAKEKVLVGRALHSAATKVDLKALGVSPLALAGPQAELRAVRARQEELARAMEPFETSAGERLLAALNLLLVPEIAQQIPNAAELRAEAERLLPVLMLLNKALPELNELAVEHHAIMLLLQSLERNRNDEAYGGVLTSKLNLIHNHLQKVAERLGQVPYPFEHVEKQTTVRQFAVPGVPPLQTADALLSASGEALDKLFTLYFRILSHLATAAEAVERAAGLPPLPEPPKENTKAADTVS